MSEQDLQDLNDVVQDQLKQVEHYVTLASDHSLKDNSSMVDLAKRAFEFAEAAYRAQNQQTA